MRLFRRALSGLWGALGWVVIFIAGMQTGQWIGYGYGARDTVRLVIEMRQGGYTVDEPWDRGGI